jgi:hypothetical protein
MIRIIFIIFILSVSTRSLACNCNETGTVDESFKYSDAVFHGKVIQKTFVSFGQSIKKEAADSIRRTLDEGKLNLFDSDFIIKLEFEVKHHFKGTTIDDTIIIYTSRTSASCGYIGFEIGKEYIVYSSSKSHVFSTFLSPKNEFEKENTYWTNHCTRTQEFNFGEYKELKALKT